MIDKWLVIAGLLLNDFGLSVTAQTHHHAFATLAQAQEYMEISREVGDFPVLMNLDRQPGLEEDIVRMEERARGGTWMFLEPQEVDNSKVYFLPLIDKIPAHPALRVPR